MFNSQQKKPFDIPLTQVDVIPTQITVSQEENLEETQLFHENEAQQEDKEEQPEEHKEEKSEVNKEEQPQADKEEQPEVDKKKQPEEEQLAPTQVYSSSSAEDESSSKFQAGNRVQVNYKQVMFLNGRVSKVIN